jgi:hypothetical protein
MGLDSESGKISCEDFGILTALKMVKEDAAGTNELQIAKTHFVCPYEGYKKVHSVLELLSYDYSTTGRFSESLPQILQLVEQ